jgi:hypothetical protein
VVVVCCARCLGNDYRDGSVVVEAGARAGAKREEVTWANLAALRVVDAAESAVPFGEEFPGALKGRARV